MRKNDSLRNLNKGDFKLKLLISSIIQFSSSLHIVDAPEIIGSLVLDFYLHRVRRFF